jgi:PadR family transcriptional regulator, regulatory protein PadR
MMPSQKPRMSSETLRILGAMLEDPLAWHYGLGLSEAAGIASGTIYPMLARLEKAGWLDSRWEEPAADEENRPRRRLYKLTGHGERAAMAELDEIAAVARRVRSNRRTKVGRRRLA